jgi:hypothetical protein
MTCDAPGQGAVFAPLPEHLLEFAENLILQWQLPCVEIE